MKTKLRPRCFFDIEIGHSPAGRIIFELYDDLCPKTTENFIKLCTGECGISETSGKKLHYRNSIFHRVIKGFMIQGGDFTNGDGTGGESIYGGRFSDENLEIRHDKPFLLSMANCGSNTNGSQFFITTKPACHLDGKHVVFGHIVSGENLVESVENLPVNAENKPIVEARISNCGELIPILKKKMKKQREKEASVESGSSKEKKKKIKSKKKKHRNKRKTKSVKEESDLAELYPKCSVRPDEIPEVPKPYFLYRGNLNKDQEKCETKDNKATEILYQAKEKIGRSGRVIKGRGQLRYYSKSPRDRFETPPHWRRESLRPDINSKLEESDDNSRRRQKSLSSSNNQDKQPFHHSQNSKSSPQNNSAQARDSREKRRKYDGWRDIEVENVSKQSKHYDKNDIQDQLSSPVVKESVPKHSESLQKNADYDKAQLNNYKSSSKQKQDSRPTIKEKPVEEQESGGSIIFPYADESDDSMIPKRSNKSIDPKNTVNETKQKINTNGTKDKIDDGRNQNYKNVESLTKTSNRSQYESSKTKLRKQRLSSSDHHRSRSVSRSPVHKKRETRSPPAHLVAKWQNRREKIMTRRSPVHRSKERNHSRSRYISRSPRKQHSQKEHRDNKSNEPSNTHKNSSEKVRNVSGAKSKFVNRSSSGTMDTSLSSAGSSVSNRPCRIDSELSDTEKTVNTQCWVNDSSNTGVVDQHQQESLKKEKAADSNSNINVDTVKEMKNEFKPVEDSLTESATVSILKPDNDKQWSTNPWKPEEEDETVAVKQINSITTTNTNNPLLPRIQDDQQKKSSQEKQENPPITAIASTITTTTVSTTGGDLKKKVPTSVSQSISKYRSPSESKSSDDENRRSSYSQSSSSRSYSKQYSSRRRSRSRSNSRSRSGYRRRYRRNSRYRRTSRCSSSRSIRRYRSRSYSRRYRSRSSTSSRSSRYRRSPKRNYRGLSFRRPSVSPRPRK